MSLPGISPQTPISSEANQNHPPPNINTISHQQAQDNKKTKESEFQQIRKQQEVERYEYFEKYFSELKEEYRIPDLYGYDLFFYVLFKKIDKLKSFFTDKFIKNFNITIEENHFGINLVRRPGDSKATPKITSREDALINFETMKEMLMEVLCKHFDCMATVMEVNLQYTIKHDSPSEYLRFCLKAFGNIEKILKEFVFPYISSSLIESNQNLIQEIKKEIEVLYETIDKEQNPSIYFLFFEKIPNNRIPAKLPDEIIEVYFFMIERLRVNIGIFLRQEYLEPFKGDIPKKYQEKVQKFYDKEFKCLIDQVKKLNDSVDKLTQKEYYLADAKSLFKKYYEINHQFNLRTHDILENLEKHCKVFQEKAQSIRDEFSAIQDFNNQNLTRIISVIENNKEQFLREHLFSLYRMFSFLMTNHTLLAYKRICQIHAAYSHFYSVHCKAYLENANLLYTPITEIWPNADGQGLRIFDLYLTYLNTALYSHGGCPDDIKIFTKKILSNFSVFLFLFEKQLKTSNAKIVFQLLTEWKVFLEVEGTKLLNKGNRLKLGLNNPLVLLINFFGSHGKNALSFLAKPIGNKKITNVNPKFLACYIWSLHRFMVDIQWQALGPSKKI